MALEINRQNLVRPELIAAAAGVAVVGAGVVFASRTFNELRNRQNQRQTLLAEGVSAPAVEQTTADDTF